MPGEVVPGDVAPGVGGTPLFGDDGVDGGVTTVPVPGCVLGVLGRVVPGMVVDVAGVEGVVDDPGWPNPPGEATLGLDSLTGVVCELPPELCVLTVPLESAQGVVLPGTVVPGIVLGGLRGVPRVSCAIDGLEVVPGVVPAPLFTEAQGGRPPGEFVSGVVVPGVVVPGAVVPGMALPGAVALGVVVPGVVVPVVVPDGDVAPG